MMTRRVALITGGCRGIGLGIAEALIEAGFALALNGTRPEEQNEEVLTRLRQGGRDVLYLQGDVGSPDDRQRMLETLRLRFDRLDVLVNNAGITSPGRRDILDAQEADFDRVVAVNLKGPYFLTQQCARWMIELRQSHRANFDPCIINVSSISAEFVSTNRGDYCLTKAATGMATKLWAVRLAEFGIRVYEIQPGVIRSDMTAGVTEKYDRLLADGLALERRWGEPSDIGRAVRTLVEGGVPYATGQVLYLDGGMRIPRL